MFSVNALPALASQLIFHLWHCHSAQDCSQTMMVAKVSKQPIFIGLFDYHIRVYTKGYGNSSSYRDVSSGPLLIP